jgi:predicted lipoprotein with Yx(FWY)xxD motif
MRCGNRWMRRHLPMTVASAVVAVLALGACGSSSSTKTAAAPTTTAPTTTAPGSTSTNTSAMPTTTQSPAQTQASIVATLAKVGPASATGKTVSLAKGPKGIFLIGPKGGTLYIFAKDKGTTTACTTSQCMDYWPALKASGTPTSGPGINAAMVTVVNGQVAYYGHLLYYFKGDMKPGDTNGTAIADFDLLGPFGNVMLPQT